MIEAKTHIVVHYIMGVLDVEARRMIEEKREICKLFVEEGIGKLIMRLQLVIGDSMSIFFYIMTKIFFIKIMEIEFIFIVFAKSASIS